MFGLSPDASDGLASSIASARALSAASGGANAGRSKILPNKPGSALSLNEWRFSLVGWRPALPCRGSVFTAWVIGSLLGVAIAEGYFGSAAQSVIEITPRRIFFCDITTGRKK